jgi:hypothetical protein
MDIKQWVMVLVGLLMLVGCVQEPHQNRSKSPEFNRVSAVSVGRSGFLLKAGDSVAWRRDIVWLDNGEAPIPAHLGKGKLAAEIEKQLMAKGLKITRSANADYHILAALMIGDSAEGNEIKQLAQLYPSLGAVSQQLPKGNVLFAISNAHGRSVLWRSAVEVMVLDDLSTSERQQRLEMSLYNLFKELPVSKRQ